MLLTGWFVIGQTRLNAFGGQTQTRLRSPRPSNGGNSRALKLQSMISARSKTAANQSTVSAVLRLYTLCKSVGL